MDAQKFAEQYVASLPASATPDAKASLLRWTAHQLKLKLAFPENFTAEQRSEMRIARSRLRRQARIIERGGAPA